MSLFKPTYFFDKIWDVSPVFLKNNGIKCVLIDVDNTLTTHDNPVPHEKILVWLEDVKKIGVKLVILSNNTIERVKPFANGLEVDFVSDASKPLTKGVKQAIIKTGVSKNEMLIIGDQIFTDVLCGKFSGVKTVLVTPFELETMPFFKFKRALENIILRKERKK